MSKILTETNLLQGVTFNSNASKLIWFCLLRDMDDDGLIYMSALSLSKELGLNESTVRRVLSIFEADGVLTNKMPNKCRKKGRIYRLCNTEVYGGRGRIKDEYSAEKKATNGNQIKTIVPDYVSPPFVAEEYREVWQMWIEYRKEINNNYKSEKSEKIGYEQMVKKSGDNPEVAKQMIEDSIASGYKGMFAPKTNNNAQRNNYPQNRVNPPRTTEERVADYQGLAGAVLRRVKARENQ